MKTGSLKDIQVLDLSRILAGPYASMTLADFGAKVIKVERPGKGDDTRAFGPPFIQGQSAYFLSVNRNKKSLSLNMKSEKGRAIISKLIERSDVLLENFRPGALERLGFGYEAVSKINPRLIYASISGFGQSGPWKEKPGYDLAVQGMGGLMSVTGSPDGPPTKFGTSIADILSGIYAVQGILLALYAREKSGKGQRVDISMLDGQVSLLTYQAGIYFADGAIPRRIGNRHPTICPYETFQASDGYFNLAVGNDTLWKNFCDTFHLKFLKEDSLFETNPQRVENRDKLFPLLQDFFKKDTVDYWMEKLETAKIPAGPIYHIGQTLSHPQVLAREMVCPLTHPSYGKIKVTGIPVKLSETPGRIQTAPPILGEHTMEILVELGYKKEEIIELQKEGVCS